MSSRPDDIRRYLSPSPASSCSFLPIYEKEDYLDGPAINDVHTILLKSSRGKGILQAYAQNQRLEKNERSLLTRLIHADIENAAVKKINVTKHPNQLSDFKMSEWWYVKTINEIKKLFPNECKHVYYDTFWRRNNGRRGKLVDHHAYEKTVMRKTKLLAEFPPYKCPSKSIPSDINNN